MVEGGTTEYKDNGWHGMYVFSDKFKGDRIYPLLVDFSLFAAHASKAAQYFTGSSPSLEMMVELHDTVK